MHMQVPRGAQTNVGEVAVTAVLPISRESSSPENEVTASMHVNSFITVEKRTAAETESPKYDVALDDLEDLASDFAQHDFTYGEHAPK